MKYQFIEEHREEFPVRRMCSVLAVSTSGYYAWRDRPASQRELANQVLVAAIEHIHQSSRETYGSPRIHAELLEKGVKCSRGRVERLMKKHDIRPKQRKRYQKTTDSKHPFPVAANILDQDFDALRPNEKWVADISYIWTQEGWLYLAAVLDLYSRKVIGWAMQDNLEASLVEQAFHMALIRRCPDAGLLHHSDRGSQYASLDYQALLQHHDVVVSMSRTGNCYDNAVMESFFGTLKTELIYHQHYETRTEAIADVFEYIEVWYNRQRRHSTLGYLSPDTFEQVWLN
jgi:putative transposase